MREKAYPGLRMFGMGICHDLGRPSLVAEVKFAEWTSKGEMRQPVYLGLRSDKRATDVVRERERPRR